MMFNSQINYSVFFIVTSLSTCLAALYPTLPVLSTVFTAGDTARLTWTDDGLDPSLSQMSPIHIDLYCGNDTFVERLAEKVSPTARSHVVFIPSDLGFDTDGYDYTLRFITEQPQRVFYTADFLIVPFGLGTVSVANEYAHTSSYVESSRSLNSSPQPSSLPNTFFSKTTGASSAISTVYADPLKKGDAGVVLSDPLKSAGARLRVNLQTIKFRFVFIVWPALVGISMAM